MMDIFNSSRHCAYKLFNYIQRKNSTSQQLQYSMGDIFLSLGVLLYFLYSHTVNDICLVMSLIFNLSLIMIQLLIFIPAFKNTIRSYLRNNHTSIWVRIRKYRLKSIAMSSRRVPIFCLLIITFSLASVYTLIASVFLWDNFEYLFVIFCLIGSTLSDACLYIRIKCDISSAFAVQTFKFFMLILSTIFFGISASENKLNSFVMGMAWLYLLTNSKKSLEKQILFYLLVFLNITFLITAFFIIISSKKAIITMMGSSIWYFVGLMYVIFEIGCQFYQFYSLYRGLSEQHAENFRKDDNTKNIQLYFRLHQMKQRNKIRIQNNPQDDGQENNNECSICLQKIINEQGIILECWHYFHLQCFEEWALLNENCPNCRASLSAVKNKGQIENY